MMRPTKLSIIVPVYNEVNTIAILLNQVCCQELPSGLFKEVIIVESNSTDGSREQVLNFVKKFKLEKVAASNAGTGIELKLILQNRPLGKGFAVREGLLQSSGDIIMIQDADLEYQVSDYPMVIEPIIAGHADFVLGSRHLSAGTWKIRKFEESTFKSVIMNLGGIFFHTFFNLTYGVKLTDPTTMYKVFRAECIRGVQFESNRFEFDYELTAKLIRLGYIPLEVPITYTSRGFVDGKKINMLRDPFLWIYAIIKFRLKKIRRLSRKESQTLAHSTGGLSDYC